MLQTTLPNSSLLFRWAWPGVEGEGRGLHSSFLHGEAFSGSVCDGEIKQETDSWLLCEALHQLHGRQISPVLQYCPFSYWLSVVGAVNHPVWLLWRWETIQSTGPGQASRVLSSVTQHGAFFAASDSRAWQMA